MKLYWFEKTTEETLEGPRPEISDVAPLSCVKGLDALAVEC